MLLARVSILSVCVLAVSAVPARGQSPTVTGEPRLVRVTSSFRPADGQPPAPIETMTLSIYGEETGGEPLWQETQRVLVNPDGSFTLLLGSTRPGGLPPDLLTSGEPRWLAIRVERPGEGDPERVMLTSATTSAAATETDEDAKAPQSWAKGDFKITFSGRSSWTSFTTRSVPRRRVFRFFWFRSSRADFRTPPLISTLGSRC